MNPRTRILLFCLVSLMLCLFLPQAESAGDQKNKVVGIVFKIVGSAKWTLIHEGNREGPALKVGSAILNGCTVRQTSPGNGTIHIGLVDGTDFTWPKNEKSGPETPPLAISNTRSGLDSFLASIADAFSTDHGRFVVTMSRAEEVKDGVVELNGDELSLRGVIRDDDPTIKSVKLESLNNQNISVGPVDLTHNAAGSPSIKVANIKPGLYQLTALKDEPGEKQPPSTAWILISSPQRFEAVLAQFDANSTRASKWTKGASPSVRRGLARATLQLLSDSEMTEGKEQEH